MKRIPLASNSPIGNIICSFTTDYFKQFEILNPFYDDSGSIIKHKDFTDCETHEPLVHSAWYVIMESGDFQILHAHNAPTPHAIMSGAIYLDIPKDIKSPQGNLNFTLNSTTCIYTQGATPPEDTCTDNVGNTCLTIYTCNIRVLNTH